MKVRVVMRATLQPRTLSFLLTKTGHCRGLQCWLVVMLCGLITTSPVHARERVRSTTGPLVLLWGKLDKAREYRGNFGGTRTQTQCERPSLRKDYSEVQRDYLAAPLTCDPPLTRCPAPEQAFKELAGIVACPAEVTPCGFNQYVTEADPSIAEEAQWGLQEALNEFMTGELMLGNDKLLQGLRTRFPGTNDESDPDQLTLLRQSVDRFGQGINGVVEQLRENPDGLRAGGGDSPPNPTFPFWVENTRKSDQASGEFLENELYRFTDLVQRSALAGTSAGKRQFFFGNATPEGRAAAVQTLKGAAQATYLHTAVLQAVQSDRDFETNNGYQLKQQVVDAQRVFEDVVAGFNPLKLVGDFVPPPDLPLETLLSNANLLVANAVSAESDAASFARSYDTDQTALQSELLNQQRDYLDGISRLTGLSNVETTYNFLSTGDDRRRLFADAQANLGGEIGAAANAVELARLDAKLAEEEVRQIPEKIRIEQDRNQQVAHVILKTGYEIAALEAASSILGALKDPIGVLQAGAKAGEALLTAIQNAKIDGINSAAAVKNLLLQMATGVIAVQRAEEIIQARLNERHEKEAELQRVVRNYVSARTNLACAYFTNPAYRLQLDRARADADQRLEAAMVQAYTAAKALESEWAERIANPVQRLDGGLPELIGDASLYTPIIKAESAFAVRSAGAHGQATPGLNTFMDALRLWDTKMRFLRFPATQRGNQTTISLRKDVLGFTGGDEAANRLAFADFIRKHRVQGVNPDNKDLLFEFQLQIADQFFFPARPNLKLESVRAALRSLPSRSVRPPDDPGNPALLTLAMLDTAVLRTFFASFSTIDEFGQARLGDDDLRSIKLQEGRNTLPSPFQSDVQASIDGFPSSTVANDQLQNLSPAVTRWVFYMDMSTGANRHLLLENLDDIELTVTYKFGRPRTFTF